jgi:SH3 domain protein
MPRHLLLAIVLTGGTGIAGAETLYVTDSLRLGIYEASDTSGQAFESLVSGTALEVLERNANYAHVRTPAGREGWVKAAYLVPLKPAAARVGELEAELASLKDEIAAARTAQQAAEDELGRLTNQTASTVGSATAMQEAINRLQIENRAYEERFELYRYSLPFKWVGLALIVTLVGGFVVGLWWLDARIRRRHGGFRIY